MAEREEKASTETSKGSTIPIVPTQKAGRVMEYLTPADPDYRKDRKTPEQKELEFLKYYSFQPHLKCAACEGWGGGVIRVDAYGPGKHFEEFCSQCVGWGFVTDKRSSVCVHAAGPARNAGNCLRNYTCTKCGYVWQVDSSG